VEYQVVNVGHLNRFPPGTHVTPQLLREHRLIDDAQRPVKILGGGELKMPLVVHAHKFSGSARGKIEAAGGQAVEVSL